MRTAAAVDLGATSGRVMLGHVDHNELSLRPVARFPNGAVQRADGLHWDIEALHGHVLAGLAAAVATGELETKLSPLPQRQRPGTSDSEILKRRWQHLPIFAEPPIGGRARYPRGPRRDRRRQPHVQPFPERQPNTQWRPRTTHRQHPLKLRVLRSPPEFAP